MQFGLLEMWAAMGTVAKTVAIILIALSIITIYMFIERLLVFRRAMQKSREIAPKLADLLKAGNLKDALARVEQEVDQTPEVVHLLEFIRASKRGVAMGPKGSRDAEPES